MILRKLSSCITKAASQYPSVTLFGPRQSGKTTLVRELFPDYSYANLEHIETRRLAAGDPEAFFRRFKPPVVIDEVQRVPELASQIQVSGRPESEIMSRTSVLLEASPAVGMSLNPSSPDDVWTAGTRLPALPAPGRPKRPLPSLAMRLTDWATLARE